MGSAFQAVALGLVLSVAFRKGYQALIALKEGRIVAGPTSFHSPLLTVSHLIVSRASSEVGVLSLSLAALLTLYPLPSAWRKAEEARVVFLLGWGRYGR